MAELDRRAHLASFDQVGVRLEDRINLFGCGYLFAVEHAAARLLDHPRAEIGIMRDLLAEGLDVQSVSGSLPRIAAISSSAILALATTSSAIAISAG